MHISKYKLAIEVDELGDCTRNIEDEIERQVRTEQRLGCKFISIDPSRENFSIIDDFSRIKQFIIKSTRKINKKKEYN